MSCVLLTSLLLTSHLIAHVTLRPTHCSDVGTGCKCDEDDPLIIPSCTINSLQQYKYILHKTNLDLTVQKCHENDFKDFLSTQSLQHLQTMKCIELIIDTNQVTNNCLFDRKRPPEAKSHNTFTICNNRDCITLNCNNQQQQKQQQQQQQQQQQHQHQQQQHQQQQQQQRKRRAIGSNSYTTPQTVFGNILTRDNRSMTDYPTMPERSEKVLMVMIGVISVVAVLVNVVIMIKLCLRKRTVIDLFAISLMLFNVMLSLYGLGMVFYIIYPSLRGHIWYCQFFTSIKLFSLGSSVYAVLLLIFHRSIENSIDIPGDEKEIQRHRIFKSIAYVLQAITLSGLLGVLSWIKLGDWNYLCVIISPRGTVDRILVFIELMYYTFAGLSVVWYLMELIYPRCKIFLKKQISILQAMFADEKRKEELLTPYLIREEAYIARDFPVFFIVFTTFTIWMVGYVVTLPTYRWFDPATAAGVRVCVVITPVILQPFLFLTMSRYNVRRFASKREKEARLSDVQTECKECTMFYTCPKCDKDAGGNEDNNMELVKMQRTKKPLKDTDAHNVQSGLSNETTTNGTQPLNKIDDDVIDENKQLLSQEEKRKKFTKAPKIDISYPSPPPYMEEVEGSGGLGRGEDKEQEQLIST